MLRTWLDMKMLKYYFCLKKKKRKYLPIARGNPCTVQPLPVILHIMLLYCITHSIEGENKL